jgi:hypothetical protein
MITRCIFLCLMAICAMTTANGQQSSSQDEHQFVVLPSDQGLLLIASQPDCPLKFEDAKLLMNLKGHWVKSFELHNQGTKPIRAYTVASIGTNEWGWEAPDPTHYIMPGQIAPPLGEEEGKDKIVPLTKELREKLKLQGPMKGIVALIVKRVEYADGSVFEEKAYESQEEYFDKVRGMMSMLDDSKKEQKHP